MNMSLDNLLWVIPGITFLFSYSRLRDVESVEFSGWPYVFFIVLIGTVAFLPTRYFFNHLGSFWIVLISSSVSFFIPFCVKFLFSFFVEKLDENENFFIPSNFWSIIYFFYPIENRDKFIRSCIEYEGEPILVTVDNPLQIKENCSFSEVKTTLFFGILVEFPYVSTSVVDSQTIRILPLLSGYSYIEKSNDPKEYQEKIKWIRKYEIKEDSKGIIIPRSRIIKMSLYNDKIDEKIVFYQ